MDGGYEDGYQRCPCFWGKRPGSLVRWLVEHVGSVSGWKVLDAGCGEGKNAAFFASRQAKVRALDVSEIALRNVAANWLEHSEIQWEVADVRNAVFPTGEYDVVIAYGLLHCLRTEAEVQEVVERLMAATRPGGFHLVCAFNDRHQELHAHPGFSPVLLSHARYISLYSEWKLLFMSDEDLHETHPHNNFPHTHSMTRLIAQKEA